MFLHPHCVCSRASLSNLQHLLSRLPVKPGIDVVFTNPGGVTRGWEHGSLWEQAQRIEGARLLVDDSAHEAHVFTTYTSGSTLVYDARGRLLFSGGITASRGHEGPSFGEEQIALLLTAGQRGLGATPVFGCAMENDTRGSEAWATTQR
jgi:hypothetical protein